MRVVLTMMMRARWERLICNDVGVLADDGEGQLGVMSWLCR